MNINQSNNLCNSVILFKGQTNNWAPLHFGYYILAESAKKNSSDFYQTEKGPKNEPLSGQTMSGLSR